MQVELLQSLLITCGASETAAEQLSSPPSTRGSLLTDRVAGLLLELRQWDSNLEAGLTLAAARVLPNSTARQFHR